MKKNTVQETLLFPLVGRAKCYIDWPKVFEDKESLEILNQIGINPEDRELSKIGNLLYGIRHHINVKLAKDFIMEHPKAHVVNLGCGLDSIFKKIDNGKIKYYNLDFPDVIELRNNYFPITNREYNLAYSMLDYKWMDEINYKIEDGIIFLCAGVLYYLKVNEVKDMIKAMSERFPKGRLTFDNEPPKMIEKSNKAIKKSGIEQATLHFKIKNPYDIKNWSDYIENVMILEDFSKDLPNKKYLSLWAKVLLKIINKKKYVYQMIIDFK
ncbi:MAG: class I SAM-dependent methyltransferase [Tissierellia bacterium]|nr:class I SAM-dependent methyltransferase [Tissierellia bacterium]